MKFTARDNKFQFAGKLDILGNPIEGIADPTNAQDAATKAWVEAQLAGVSGVTSVNGDTGPAVMLTAADVGADASGTAAAAIVTHVGLSDPHTQYALESALATVANTGAYADLSGKPTLGTASALASDTDGALAANSDIRIATQKAVRTFVENMVAGLLDLKGDTNASANPNYPAASKGDAYYITAAGRVGGASGKQVDIGDVVVAKADNAGGTEASVGTSWFVLEHNLVGAVLTANNLSDLASPGTALTNLGGTTVGKALFLLTNPSAVRFLRINADNTVTARTAVEMLSDLGAAASGAVTASGLTMTTARLLGRTTASTGVVEEITVGAGLSLSSGQLSATATAPMPNLLHNGGFEVWQRGTSAASVADDAYRADRWYTLTQTAAINVEQVAAATGAVTRYAARMTQTQATAQRFGIAQILEAADSIPLRGRGVHFRCRVKPSGTMTLHCAILEHTGTDDVVTSDVVNSWTNGTYTSGNFFGTYTVVATGTTTTAGLYADLSCTGTVSTSCKNLIVLVWTTNTVAQTVTLDVTECDLHDGSAAQTWSPRPIGDETALCQRYALALVSQPLGIGLNANVLYSFGSLLFPAPMRATPSLAAGATYAVNAGSAGTVALLSASSAGTGFFNSASNWTTGANVYVTALLTADL